MSLRLPLFPLPVVLFPSAPMPLHIFEPRYRQMLADCLEGDERFALVSLEEPVEPPPPGALGCVALIRGTDLLPDGRSNIVVQGQERFTLERVVPSALPYLVGEVAPFEDAEGEVLPETAEFRRMAEQYLGLLQSLSDQIPTDLELPDDTAALTFQLAAAADLDAVEKRRLLASRSVSERVRRLTVLLQSRIQALAARVRVHLRARSNGKGGPSGPEPIP